MRRTPSTRQDGSVLRSRQVVLAAAAAGAAALLIGSTLVVLTLRPAVVDSDGDGIPDSVEAATQRTVVAATAEDTFTIVSRLASAPYQDQFEVSYKAGTFVVTYERARGSDSSYQLELRNLVEWVDANRNNRNDPGLGVDSAAYEGVVTRAPELQGDLVLYAASLAAAVFLIALSLKFEDRH